ncbi:hypothetical protein ORD22_05930 [Sporosarcina sp. GW1-11]|uniref:hypothetical protein n=1 Tax=Sporosarcina sp. GW1-11 TaxID=2899126 RepID=UPI00294E2DCF|nr:hypothetical protein [Sporosarcina sp. GW1-11]MDV6377801.1 hypothetical protein [Sporosarcina sp. GW1-11]
MGRDEHKKGSNNSGSLPQTPKNEKIAPKDMREEMAKELTELRKQPKKQGRNNS